MVHLFKYVHCCVGHAHIVELVPGRANAMCLGIGCSTQ